MAQFEFSPLADSVTVIYKCPHCGKDNTESFSVPSPDFSAETHHDSETQEFYDAQCGNCDAMYNVIITNGFYGGLGEIEDVEEISKVDEEIPGEDDDYFDKLLFKETHSDTEKALDAIEPLPQEIKDNLYRMLYANIISKLEAFLCDTMVNFVINSDVHKRQFVQNYPPLSTQKFQMSAIYAKYESLDKIIKGALTSIVYHDIDLVRKLYKNVVGIDLPNTKAIEEAIEIRHHIIHRNGKDKEGNIISVTKEDVEILSNHVSDFIFEIDTMISGVLFKEKNYVQLA